MKFGTGDAQVEVNTATRAGLFRALRQRLSDGTGFALATLNLDHLTKLPHDPAFLAAYQAHDLIVADGRPIVWLSKLAGHPVELMPGSELIAPINQWATSGSEIFYSPFFIVSTFPIPAIN